MGAHLLTVLEAARGQRVDVSTVSRGKKTTGGTLGGVSIQNSAAYDPTIEAPTSPHAVVSTSLRVRVTDSQSYRRHCVTSHARLPSAAASS